MPARVRSIRTLSQARTAVLQHGILGIFSDEKPGIASLWQLVDLPERQPGEKGWGQKVTSIWRWKNELPARYPEEIFYGKIPGGVAALMSLPYLRSRHYPAHARPLESCSPLARKIHRLLRLDPLTTPEVRQELGMTQRPERNQVDRALVELQVTLHIVRRNALEDKLDTWVLFHEQYSGFPVK